MDCSTSVYSLPLFYSPHTVDPAIHPLLYPHTVETIVPLFFIMQPREEPTTLGVIKQAVHNTWTIFDLILSVIQMLLHKGGEKTLHIPMMWVVLKICVRFFLPTFPAKFLQHCFLLIPPELPYKPLDLFSANLRLLLTYRCILSG